MPGSVEFALRIRLGDLQIAKGHADVVVPHQFLKRRQANPTAEQVGGPGVAQAVWRDRVGIGTACACVEIGQREAQRLKQGEPATHARQQEAFRFLEAGGGSLRTQLTNTR